MNKRSLDRTSISLQMSALVAAVIFVCSFTIIGLMEWRVTERLQARIGDRLSGLAEDMAERLDRGLFDAYGQIQTVARLDPFIAHHTDQALKRREWLADLQRNFPHYAWIGFARTDGTVEVATGGLLEGQSVAERPWFKEALKAPFIGDLHEALLLQKYLNSPTTEPLRFVDVAAPIYDPAGRVIGVVGAHLYWAWAQDIRTSVLRPDRTFPETDILVLDSAGRTVLGPSLGRSYADLGAVQKMIAGAIGAQTEVIDGVEKLVGFAPTQGYRDFGGLGWRILATTPTAVAYAPIWEVQVGLALLGVISGLVGAALSYGIARRLTLPLKHLAEDAERSGRTLDTVFLSRSGGSREVVRLSQALRALIRRIGTYEQSLASVSAEASALAEDNSSLRELAMTDPMTGLLNRRGFFESVDSLLAATAKPADDISVLVLDIDRFKTINDAHGHAVGDTVIKGVARLCRQQGRDSDLVARFGGEEFVVLLPGCPGPAAVARADRLRRLIAETPISTKAGPVSVTVSIGIALFSAPGEAVNKVIDRADQALYHAKRNGRNRVEAHFQITAE
ncbi:diguanylate cyclase [Elstera sp.]|jgi:diguanylate cyclase (GGDEF)-like protein|uniref:diguanylate cyclase n=1 Tax=Elstera sp. TaxID=1916664 RepID=UPI0037C18002